MIADESGGGARLTTERPSVLATLAFLPLIAWLKRLFSPGGRKLDVGASPFPPGAGPARLLIMRHAEKTGDKADMHLSAEGEKRAAVLASYIPQTFGRPDFLVAAMQSKHSNRSYETLVPLSRAAGVAIDERFEDTDAGGLVEALGLDEKFRGKSGVVCWHHSALPDLVADLGAPDGTFPAEWNPDVFNLIIEMRFADGRPPQVRQIVEPF